MQRRNVIKYRLALGVMGFCLWIGVAAAAEQKADPSLRIIDEAIYKKEYKDLDVKFSGAHLNFVFDNFTYLMDIIQQSEPDFLKTNFGGRFRTYVLQGEPEAFDIRSPNNFAKIQKVRPSPNTVVYWGKAETRRFAVPLLMDFAIRISIHEPYEGGEKSKIDLMVAMRPQSAFVAQALVPLQSIFSAQVNEVADHAVRSMNDFFQLLHQKVPAYLTQRNLLAQFSKLYQAQQALQGDRIAEADHTGSGVRWSVMLAIVVVALGTGWIIGHKMADSTRGRRAVVHLKALRSILEGQQQLGEALSNQLTDFQETQTMLLTKAEDAVGRLVHDTDS